MKSIALSKAAMLLDLADYIRSQPDGVSPEEAMALCPIRQEDHQAGWLVNEMRREGFLVQVENNLLYIEDRAQLRTGTWMRHPKLGVVKVQWERLGFPKVRVRQPGSDVDHIVVREELSGN